MEIEDKVKNHRQNTNNTSHKIFKGVVLFIVAVFFYLIYSFVKIQFFTPQKNKGFNFDLNSDKYRQLDIRDQHYQYLPNKNRGDLQECNLRDFYYEHVSNYKPCFISKKTNSDLEIYFNQIQQILQENLNFNQNEKTDTSLNYIEKNLKGLFNKMGLMEFAKILNFSQLFLKQGIEKEKKLENENKTNSILSQPVLSNKDYIFLQLEGDTQFIMCPITQINRLKVYRENEETNNISKFNPIYSGRDFFELFNKKEDRSNLIIMSVNLQKGDMLYVPSYYFISNNFPKIKEDKLLKFEFESNSRILNTMFKVLFDDNFDMTKEQENNFMS